MEKKPLFSIIFNTNNVDQYQQQTLISELVTILVESWNYASVDIEYVQKAPHEEHVPIAGATLIGIKLTEEELNKRYDDWWA